MVDGRSPNPTSLPTAIFFDSEPLVRPKGALYPIQWSEHNRSEIAAFMIFLNGDEIFLQVHGGARWKKRRVGGEREKCGGRVNWECGVPYYYTDSLLYKYLRPHNIYIYICYFSTNMLFQNTVFRPSSGYISGSKPWLNTNICRNTNMHATKKPPF